MGDEAGAAPKKGVVTSKNMGKVYFNAWSMDDADGSLHLFIAIWNGGANYPPSITLTDAREQGFNRVLGVFEQSRDGWLTDNIEESRPLWALARRISIHTAADGAARPCPHGSTYK